MEKFRGVLSRMPSRGMCNRAQNTRTAFVAQTSNAPRTSFHRCFALHAHATAQPHTRNSVSATHSSGRWFSVDLAADDKPTARAPLHYPQCVRLL
ncbi:hypothetical protein HBH98_033990 [Parastagonospora nodorum]|nr:hypothetical protein HBH52_043930 [Parastagonospora nodorum]KAH4040298.1 hypothetical protein HBI09_026260 [Parastagonospora nodorum]KAH4071384.1 hypothetical protein HBH50_080000 [Parastagonospora nodorum]KAH4094079.1 hypothetical protein HBH48_068250 [Parastagonospora nodorum]KAH4205329.1 hypothetical protein HBI95_136260 [Parastagonospora nodorum]